jgi:hypothetical protein
MEAKYGYKDIGVYYVRCPLCRKLGRIMPNSKMRQGIIKFTKYGMPYVDKKEDEVAT